MKTGLIIFAFAAVAFYVFMRILRHIKGLEQTAQEALADLQLMSEKKQDLERNLQKTRGELEIQVEKRTAALRKEIEDRLLIETKYRKIMDASPVPIVVFDMDGKPIFINLAFTHTFGWTLEEFQEEKTNYIPDGEQELNVQIRRKIIRGEGGHGIETRRYNKKGGLLDVSISFDVWRGKDDRPIGCVVILHDITQKKQMEKQLFQAQKMEAMGTLAGGIAHDFNNILSGIFSFSQLAHKHAGETEKAREHVDQIIKGARRASGLVQQILTYCRQKNYKKELFNLETVLKETLDLLSSTLPPDIRMESKIEPDIFVMADPTQIHSVIMNICTNACHAMLETGGTLSVLLEKTQLPGDGADTNFTIAKAGKYAQLEVSDTGHGMDEETMERSFDPYFTTKENGKGTGFGLALVRAIIESHEGYISVRSAPGKGTCFKVHLPVAETSSGDQAPVDSAGPEVTGGTERIMVVDDEESIRMAVTEFLEDYGYRVSSFPDGESALAEFQKAPESFDLILTDMAMPKMNGDRLASEILSIRKEIPVILSTGYTEKISEKQAVDSGIKFFIQKPISNERLEALIRKSLSTEQRISTSKK